MELTDFSLILPSPHRHSLAVIDAPPEEWCICHIDEPSLKCQSHPESTVHNTVHSRSSASYRFAQTCTHPFNITQIFTTLNIGGWAKVEMVLSFGHEPLYIHNSGGETGVQGCEEQYCIGTWNIRSMNQGKLEVVKMARVNMDILGISELKWI